MLQKLGRRVKSLAEMDWSDAKRAKVAEVMYCDYMSSEESDVDDGGNKIYVVRPLQWQSDKLTKKKKALDRHHSRSLARLVRERLGGRIQGTQSTREVPDSCPGWAKKDNV